MSDNVLSILDRIKQERDRQKSLPGSELDGKNSVNDWIAIASHYLIEPAKRKGSSRWSSSSQADYEDSLIKSAAVILAALEYSEALKNNGELE